MKTAPEGAVLDCCEDLFLGFVFFLLVLLRLCGGSGRSWRGRRGSSSRGRGSRCLDKIGVVDRLAALDDRDWRELAVLHREDRHLGVLAIAFLVEDDLAG